MARRKGGRHGAPSPQRPALPEPGTVVRFGLVGSDRAWSTRVEWVDGRSMCVAAPLGADGRAVAVAADASVTIGWPTAAGYLEAAGRFRGAGRDVVPTWTVRVERVERDQRRSAYRLEVWLPLVLRIGDGRVAGTTRDLSEGGLRCVVACEQVPVVDEIVEVDLTLGDDLRLLARATVVRTGPVRAGEVEVGLAYRALDSETAEALRRYVFAAQLRRRGAQGA